MNQDKRNLVPEIIDGGVVEIFACGGQCRGKNCLPVFVENDQEDVRCKLQKVS